MYERILGMGYLSTLVLFSLLAGAFSDKSGGHHHHHHHADHAHHGDHHGVHKHSGHPNADLHNEHHDHPKQGTLGFVGQRAVEASRGLSKQKRLPPRKPLFNPPTVKNLPSNRQFQQVRPQIIPSRRQVSNTLRNILRRRPLIDLSRVPSIRNNIINQRNPFLGNTKSKRRSQESAGLRNNRIYVPTIANLKAEKIPGFQKFELHDAIRAREGTEIFEEGRKPDVIHYVSSPNTENKDALIEKIDVRTPQDVNIKAEAKED